jgi:flavodoxin
MVKMKNSKIVLISKSGYSKKHEELLVSYLDQGYELFCVVGKQCELWEEIMDELAVGDGTNSRYITTTSHPDETEEEVIEFAKNFSINKESGVVVVRI